MTTKNSILPVHPALGGLDRTTDSTILDPNFLVQADNLEYLEDGRRKKRLGMIAYAPTTSYANGSTVAGFSTGPGTGGAVSAFADIWNYAGTIVPTQRIVAVNQGSIFRSTGNGMFTAVTATSSFTGAGSLYTNITIAQDYAVISNVVQQPVAYNPATTTLVVPTTGAAWPWFEYSVFHLNRLWIAGINGPAAEPHAVKYHADGNIFDSTGIDTGNFVFDSGDGDRVIGISQPFFDSLLVFKGPQRGSIHRLEGRTPTTFSRSKIVTGAPSCGFKSIITTPTDVFWMSAYGIHSLQTTLKYGDFEAGFLSLPIQDIWRKRMVDTRFLGYIQGFYAPHRNIIGWLIPVFTTFPFNPSPIAFGMEIALVYNYALSDPTPGGKKYWSIWKMPEGMHCAATMIRPGAPVPINAGSISPALYFGTADQNNTGGRIYFADYEHYEDATFLPIVMTAKTPTIMRYPFGNQVVIPETQEKVYAGVTTFFNSQTGGTGRIEVLVDGRSQTGTFDLGTGQATLT